MTDTEKTARRMMKPNSMERKEAEKMMGCSFERMTPQQRVLAAQMITAFLPQIQMESSKRKG